jgi:hypothetical protein
MAFDAMTTVISAVTMALDNVPVRIDAGYTATVFMSTIDVLVTMADRTVSTCFDIDVLALSTRVQAISGMVRKRLTHMTQSEQAVLETKVATKLV